MIDKLKRIPWGGPDGLIPHFTPNGVRVHSTASNEDRGPVDEFKPAGPKAPSRS